MDRKGHIECLVGMEFVGFTGIGASGNTYTTGGKRRAFALDGRTVRDTLYYDPHIALGSFT